VIGEVDIGTGVMVSAEIGFGVGVGIMATICVGMVMMALESKPYFVKLS
jgi:hypothetical protein